MQLGLHVPEKFQYGKESVNSTFVHERKPLALPDPSDQNVDNLHQALSQLIQAQEIYPSLLANHDDWDLLT